MVAHESKQKLRIPDRSQLHSRLASIKTGSYSLQYIMFEHNMYLHTDMTHSPRHNWKWLPTACQEVGKKLKEGTAKYVEILTVTAYLLEIVTK